MTILGRKPRNHPDIVRVIGPDDAIDDRGTPHAVWAPLHAEFGFTRDAAASERNAKLPRYWTRADDGLRQSWVGERIWCNPPFSALGDWVAKAHAEARAGCECVVMLVPANRCEQGWWQVYVERYRDRGFVDGVALSTRFLAGRTAFFLPDQTRRKSPFFGCVLLIWLRDRMQER